MVKYTQHDCRFSAGDVPAAVCNLEKFELSVRGIYPFNILLYRVHAHMVPGEKYSLEKLHLLRKVPLIVLRSHMTTIHSPILFGERSLLYKRKENNEKSLCNVYLSSEKVSHQ